MNTGKVNQKIELTANILIIVVAVLLIGVFTQRYFFSDHAASAQPKSPTVGNKVEIAGFDWSRSSQNVLLVLKKGCRYCSESAGFYKKLIQQAKEKNIAVTAVLPEDKDEANKYLEEIGISGIGIVQSQLNSLDVGGTPTIIITNNQGGITNVWLGKLPPEKETEVINQLKL